MHDALPIELAFADAHGAQDVRDLDNRVVDPHPRHEAQGEQCHLVEVEPHHLDEPEAGNRRERNRERRNEGRAPIAQEQEHDDDREERALDHRVDRARRSEEHTSELQSLMRISYAVFCLKKKTTKYTNNTTYDESSHSNNKN